jgi:hypothetical protein
MDKDLRIKELDKIKFKTKPYTQVDVVYKGRKQLMDVFRIPTELLVYNKYNGRILSHVKSFERQFRALDAEAEEDKKVIEDFLWNSKADRNKDTLDDLRDYGQKQVGIVTRDGIIIDGNRRASLLNKLAKERKEPSAYFNAVILEDTLDDNPREIMRMETMYQMGEDEKLDYNPIEKYLKCKDLVALGFNPTEIGKMMREDESRIEEWLSIMKLMDNYLDDLDYSGIYTRLDKREGQFVDLNKYLKKYDDGSPIPDWGYKPSDVSDLKTICFDYIRAQYEGKEFRAIAQPTKRGSFFCRKKVWEKFKDEHFKSIDHITNAETSVKELIQRSPDADLSEILKVRDEDWEFQAYRSLKANLDRSQRDLEDINEENEPRVLLRRAKETLNSINPKNDALHTDEEVARLVREIGAIISQFEHLISEKQK